MNRRAFTTTALSAALLPTASFAFQEATPEGHHPPENEPVDPRTRTLTHLLQSIAPVTLLDSLEQAPVNNQILITAAGDTLPTVIPWADFGDTDLYSSLGGVVLTPGDPAIHDPGAGMLGGYIVYESAEIAYHEFTRKLGSVYDNPSMTSSVAGTNVWVMESEDLSIGTCRIGYVMMMALVTDDMGTDIVAGIIEHLTEVADSIVPE